MKLQRFYLLLIFTLLWLPIVQWVTPLVKEQRLFGVEEKAKQPDFSWQSLWDGKFQEQFDKWFSGAIGFRSYLIKSENELNFSLFRDISSRSPSKIVLGKENYLFERSYVSLYSNPDHMQDEALRKMASAISRLQTLLAERGIAFVLLLSPHKPSLYPEYLPDHVPHPQPGTPEDYQKFVSFLQEGGVHFIDGKAFLREEKSRAGTPVFPKSGTHWSYYASCMLANMLSLEVERQLGENLYNIDCTKTYTTHIPRYQDQDLAQLLNIWRPHKTFETLPYPIHSSIITGGETRPRAVIVGSSFMWPILYYLDKRKIFKRRDFFYYFRTNHTGGRKVPIDPKTLDWEKKVFSRKAIIIEVNESVLPFAGFGFVPHALKWLEKNRPTLGEETKDLSETK